MTDNEAQAIEAETARINEEEARKRGWRVPEEFEPMRVAAMLHPAIEELQGNSPSQYGDDDPVLDETVKLNGILIEAADALIEVHEATGINLYGAPPWLALVHAVYPEWQSAQRSH